MSGNTDFIRFDWAIKLKRGYIREDTQAPGLQEAHEKIDYMRLSNVERHEYESFMMRVHQQNELGSTSDTRHLSCC